MAEEQNPAVLSSYQEGEAEVKDRGLFDFMGKKEEHQEEVLVAGVEKVHIEEAEQPEEKKHGLLDKLHRSHSSSSSSSSDDEAGEGENKEKKKKKKGLKEKLHGEKKEEEVEVKQEVLVVAQEEDTTIVVEKVEVERVEAVPEEEKKGFLEKIKDKLPGHHKKPAEEGVAITTPPPPPPVASEYGDHPAKEQEGEKKGFLEKIKEKLPGYHKSGGEECEKTAAGH